MPRYDEPWSYGRGFAVRPSDDPLDELPDELPDDDEPEDDPLDDDDGVGVEPGEELGRSRAGAPVDVPPLCV